MNGVFLAVSVAMLLQQETPRPAKEYPVKMEVSADRPAADRTQRIRVKLTIQEGYHIYAVPIGNESLPADTSLTLSVKGAKITYPPGEVVKDEVIGDYNVYRKQVTLEAVVKRAEGDKTPIEVKMRVRPYDQRGCLWQTRTLKATVS